MSAESITCPWCDADIAIVENRLAEHDSRPSQLCLGSGQRHRAARKCIKDLEEFKKQKEKEAKNAGRRH